MVVNVLRLFLPYSTPCLINREQHLVIASIDSTKYYNAVDDFVPEVFDHYHPLNLTVRDKQIVDDDL
jgi:hypothetical protein